MADSGSSTTSRRDVEENRSSLGGKVRRHSLPVLLHPQADFKWKGKNNLGVYAHANTRTRTRQHMW